MRITADFVIDCGPCIRYDRARIEALLDGRKWIMPRSVPTLPISEIDRVWLLLQHGVLSEAVGIDLGCDFAERSLIRDRDAGREPPPILWVGIEMRRRWVRGEVTDMAMTMAGTLTESVMAETLAESAVEGSAARLAGLEAIRGEAWEAAWQAARAAVMGGGVTGRGLCTEAAWQLQRIRRVMGW